MFASNSFETKQQRLLIKARAEAAAELAAEGLRLLLAKDWMTMGQEMAQTKGVSVLMVDLQSPASLLAALKGLQEKG